MSDQTNSAVSSPATDTGGSAIPAANPGSAYTPTGGSFFRHMAPSPSGEGAREAARADLAAARGIPQEVAPSADNGGQALSPATDTSAAVPTDAAPTNNADSPQTEAEKMASAVENDDVSALPLHLQDRGKQLIEQKNRFKSEAETLRAEQAAWKEEIDFLKANGYQDAASVKAYREQQSAQRETDRLAQEDAEFEAQRAQELAEGDDGLYPEQAERIAAREVEARRREREAEAVKTEATSTLQKIEYALLNQRFDTAITTAHTESPILRDFAQEDGKGLGQAILEEMARSGLYAPEQLPGIGKTIASRITAALAAQETQVAAKYAADLANKQAAAPPSIGRGGTPPATGAPTNYTPTGGTFAKWMQQPRKTL